MAYTPTAQDYQAFAKSLEGLSSTEQAAKVNEMTATLHSQGIPVDETFKSQYINPVMQSTVNQNVGISPTVTGTGSTATVGTGGSGITVGGGTDTTSLNLAPTSGAPTTTIGTGTSGVTGGSTGADTLQSSFPITGGTGTGGQNVTIEPGMGSTVTGMNTGVTPGTTIPTAGVVTQPAPETPAQSTTTTETAPAYQQTRGEMYRQYLGEQALGERGLVPGTEFTPVTQGIQTDEMLATDIATSAMSLTAGQAGTAGLEITSPQKTAAQTYQAYTVEGTPQAVAAQGKLSQESLVGDVQGVVSQQSLADAAQGTVSKEATVQYQLGELFKSFEEGKPAPAWAAPAVRNIGAMMAQRGLGTSSMAAAAVTQAIMEAGIPIAQADAQTYATVDLANLNNRQQAALQNAATYAAMDRANLDARMQAAVTNAQAFLSLDMANLSNQQRSNELTHQAEVQSIFSNQAAENAAAQFAATSQNQVDQFYAEMEVQVQNANANRLAAQEQFNVNEGNAMKQFVASMNDARERFETQLRVQIDQSNVQWRRDINTANTALQNESNRINAQNLLGLTTQAQNNLWQEYRDETAWLYQMSENATQREHELGMLAMEVANNQDVYDTQLRNSVAGELGKAVIRSIFS